MPHDWNNIVVVTQDELLPWFSCLKTLQQRIHRDKSNDYGIKKVQSGGNGRQLLIAFDSLPREIQDALGDPRRVYNILEVFYKTDADAVSFYNGFEFEDGSYLSHAHQEQYIANASVLQAVLQLRPARIAEWQKMGRTSLKGLYKSLVADVIEFNTVLGKKFSTSHTLPASEKRFKTVLRAFEKSGYNSLVSKKHGNSNSKKVTDQIMSLLNSMFASQEHKPTRTEVARQYDIFIGGMGEVVNHETGELFSPSNFRKLSEATIINWLGKWQNRIGTYAARSGNRQKLIQQFRPHHSFMQPKFSGSIISVDDRQPVFTYDNKHRPWFYNAIDLASEAFTCSVYGTSKEGIIDDFYRQMVRDYAERGWCLPYELEGEMSLNSKFLNTILKPGNMFTDIHIEANNARGKRIEAYYRPLRYEYEKKREGWLARPFALSESNQAGTDKKVIVPYNEIIKGCRRDIQTWNNAPHSKYPEISRWDYHLANLNPNLKPINYKGILPYIGYRTPTSCNVGSIRLNYQEFLLGDKGELFVGDRLVNLMKRIEGQDIDVYWLNANDGSVLKALIYIGDMYMGEAIEKPIYQKAKAEQTPQDLRNRQAMSSYVATIDAYMREAKSNLERLMIIDNRPSTIGTSFVMPGLDDDSRIKQPSHGEVETLPNHEEHEDLDQEPEYISHAKPLADRF